MEKSQIIEVLNKWNFWSKELDIGILRKDYLVKLLRFVKTDKIISIVGIRRSGKSTLIKQMAKSLGDELSNRNNILIINFEEPEFEDTDINFLQRIYEAYMEIIKPKGKPFIFLDEIQNVKKWERFVRSLNERKSAFITVSGSSSKLLSEELATVLTGRQIYFEVFPLNFKEFLLFEKLEIKDKKAVLLNSQKIKTFFREYIEFGGFPEIALNKDSEFRVRTLRSYYEDIINRDIVQRFKVKKIDKLRALARFYLTNISSLISFTKISRFVQLPTETVRRFSSYLETSNLIFFIKRFSFSVKEQENSPRKVYSIDVGLPNAIGFRFSENLGKLTENIVAIELKRKQIEKNLEIYYWKENYEVDFVVKDGLKVKELLQVCWDISSYETKEREVKSLLKAMKKFKLKEGLVITEDFEGNEKFNGRIIKFIPLWKWLISSQL
ncbi:MAG: ATP-binding protein [Candidatus Thermoplasmatota archaeon]